MPPEAWQRVVRYTAGQEPRADVIVPSRLAEVLIHHVDLDLRYRPRDWPAWLANDMLSSTAAALGEGRTMTPPVRLAGTDTGNVFVIGAVGPRTRVDGVAIRPIRRPSAVPVGQGPRAIAITPDGRTAYVASWQGGTVTPIATATNTAGTPIEVGEGARAIAVTP